MAPLRFESGEFSYPGLSVFAKAGNRMGTARRCNLARLFFTIRKRQDRDDTLTLRRPEGFQILSRVCAFN